LRNFFVGLDFYGNEIAIGLNKGTTVASIIGTSKHTKPEKSQSMITFIVIFFVSLVSIALYFLKVEI
jgi:hypothetical protein